MLSAWKNFDQIHIYAINNYYTQIRIVIPVLIRLQYIALTNITTNIFSLFTMGFQMNILNEYFKRGSSYLRQNTMEEFWERMKNVGRYWVHEKLWLILVVLLPNNRVLQSYFKFTECSLKSQVSRAPVTNQRYFDQVKWRKRCEKAKHNYYQ